LDVVLSNNVQNFINAKLSCIGPFGQSIKIAMNLPFD